jgi:hypothetical protein
MGEVRNTTDDSGSAKEKKARVGAYFAKPSPRYFISTT